jgi:hypothetical protein
MADKPWPKVQANMLGIPTQANKCYRHLSPLESCELRGFGSEDCFHACVQCPHATVLRHAMRAHWVLPVEEDLIQTSPDSTSLFVWAENRRLKILLADLL